MAIDNIPINRALPQGSALAQAVDLLRMGLDSLSNAKARLDHQNNGTDYTAAAAALGLTPQQATDLTFLVALVLEDLLASHLSELLARVF